MTEGHEHDLAEAAWSLARRPGPLLLQRATRHIVDFVGIFFAGATAPEMAKYLEMLRVEHGIGGNGAPFVLNDPISRSARAAFVGAAGHFHDFDDDDPALSIGHPIVAVIAAALATVQPHHTSIDLLGAYVSGIEAMCRIAACVNPGHSNRGAHATASVGVFGAAIASGLVRGCKPEELAAALGFAATSSSGLKSASGSSAKPIQVGSAAARGVEASAQALGGLRPSSAGVFGLMGWVDMNGELGLARTTVHGFARSHALESPGVNIKRYPCCSSSHTLIDATLALIRRHALQAADIDRMTVWIGPDVPAILPYDRPRTALEGKFSLRFPMAVAILTRSEPSLDDFSDGVVTDETISTIMGRIIVEIDPALPRAAGGVTHCARVQVETRSGQVDEVFAENPIGSVALPLDDAGLRKKFLACAAPVLGIEKSQAAFGCLMKGPDGIAMSVLFEKFGLRSE